MVVKLTLQEKIEIVLIVGDHCKPIREAALIFNTRHPDKMVCSATIANVMNKFKATGSVENVFKKQHNKWSTIEEKQLNVMQAVVENPKMSLRKLSKTIPGDVKKSTASNILKVDKFHPYNPKYIHTLLPRDFESRFLFCAWFQGECEVDPFFARKILFTDEATFTSNGVVCSQNCRWWSDNNPNFLIECRSQYLFKTNVWGGIVNNRIVGPYFFRQNINTAIYLDFLRNQLSQFLDELPLNIRRIIWYQHDGAPCHSTNTVTGYLNEVFPHRWIGRRSNIPWPARSPDITPLDFFLWGRLKEMVYGHRPFQDIDHLEAVITNCVQEITPDMIRATVGEMTRRTVVCMEKEGGHVET